MKETAHSLLHLRNVRVIKRKQDSFYLEKQGTKTMSQSWEAEDFREDAGGGDHW